MPQRKWDTSSSQGRARLVGRLPSLRIMKVRCGVHTSGWSGAEFVTAYQVLLVTRGGFLQRINGRESFADTMSALLLRPGDEMRVAHPLGFGDMFTVLDFAEPPDARLAGGAQRIDDEVFLLHRKLLALCQRGTDQFQLADLTSLLLSSLSAPAHRPNASLRHQRLADKAVEMLVEEGFATRLDELAAANAVTPAHLSRTFHAVTGMTLAAYRNRLRVRAVLADLQDGAPSLTDLASAYGFADQSHLIRVVRQQFHTTPSALRRLLTR